MKLRNACFDADEKLERVTVEMSANELALIYRLAGSLRSLDITNTAGAEWAAVLYDVCDAGSILNQFFDEGADALIPSFNLFREST